MKKTGAAARTLESAAWAQAQAKSQKLNWQTPTRARDTKVLPHTSLRHAARTQNASTARQMELGTVTRILCADSLHGKR